MLFHNNVVRTSLYTKRTSCTHVYTVQCTRTPTHPYTASVCTCACVFVWLLVCLNGLSEWGNECCVFVCVCVWVSMHTWVCLYIYSVCACIHECVCIYIVYSMCMHTWVCLYIYIVCACIIFAYAGRNGLLHPFYVSISPNSFVIWWFYCP